LCLRKQVLRLRKKSKQKLPRLKKLTGALVG
jgi:hypothetical protein